VKFRNRFALIDEEIEFMKKKDLVFILQLLGISCHQINDTVSLMEEKHRSLLTEAHLISLQKKKVCTFKQFLLKLKSTPLKELYKQSHSNRTLYNFFIFQVEDLFNFGKHSNTCITGKDINLNFLENSFENKNNIQDRDFIINLNSSESDLTNKAHFNLNAYTSSLDTETYGQNIIVTDTINSTHTVFTGVNINSICCDGLVVHAKRQLKGKGRTGNQWLSPLGCMMFSMQIDIPVVSNLGRSLSMVQHLVIVAFVRSIKKRGHGYQGLDLNIKWPNDIYINHNVKIGGIIVNSSLWQNNFKITIGLGVNVSNEKPTDCLNSLVRGYNAAHGEQLPELEIEDVMAGTLNEIESLVKSFQKDGVEMFKREYYKYWLHEYVFLFFVRLFNFPRQKSSRHCTKMMIFVTKIRP